MIPMFMNRRAFLRSSGLVAFGASVPCLSSFASASSSQEPFRWSTDDLVFSFEVKDGRLRQKCSCAGRCSARREYVFRSRSGSAMQRRRFA